MPRLTVLLPVKDGARTIGTAVRSTLRAMPRDSELLVVDDGSRDATGAALDRVDDRRLRVVRHDRAQGVASALNHALAISDSARVARMDADDVSLPWRFRVQLPALADADVVFGSMVLIDQRGLPTGLSSPGAVQPEAAALHLLLENPFAHPTMVAERAPLVAAGGYRSTPVEDYDLWLRLAAEGHRLRKLRSPVLAYRRHAGQATQSWTAGAPDPLLDESFRAALPQDLRSATAQLRTAAVFRDPAAAPEWPRLVDHVRAAAAALPPAQRDGLLRRVARLAG